MRINLFFLIALILLLETTGCSQEPVPDNRGYIVKVGDTLSDFSVKFLDDSTKNLSEFYAPVIVLNFFASWCGVCRKEIPHIEKEIWQPLKNKDLLIIGVNYKEKPSVVQKAVNEIGMTYPVALDEDGKIFKKFARGGVARNVVLDKNLNIIFLSRLFDQQEFEQMKTKTHQQLGIKENKSLSLIKEGDNVEQNFLTDFADTNKKIELQYNGKHQIHLEGRIFSVEKKKLEIGVSLFEEDIFFHKYDKKAKSFRIGYRHYEGIRIAVLPLTKFKVAADVEKIIVFDAD